MAIFVLLQYLYKLRIFFLALVVLPLFTKGQDSIVLPKEYTPVFNWAELNDSLTLEYQTLYPKTWLRDSTYIARGNKIYVDSIFKVRQSTKKFSFDSLRGSTYVSQDLSNTPPPNQNNIYTQPVPAWVYWIVVVLLLGVIFLKYANIRLFNLLFLSLLSPNHCDETLREHDTPINIYNLVATLLCAVVYALFIFFVAKTELVGQIHNSPSVVFLIIFIAIAIFYMLRYLVIMIAAAVLDAEYVYSVLLQVTVSGNMWIALLVLPVVAIINTVFFEGYKLHDIVFYAWLVLMLYIVFKQVRVFIQSAKSFPHSIVYLILYLCALEIAPYMAIYKLVVNKLG